MFLSLLGDTTPLLCNYKAHTLFASFVVQTPSIFTLAEAKGLKKKEVSARAVLATVCRNSGEGEEVPLVETPTGFIFPLLIRAYRHTHIHTHTTPLPTTPPSTPVLVPVSTALSPSLLELVRYPRLLHATQPPTRTCLSTAHAHSMQHKENARDTLRADAVADAQNVYCWRMRKRAERTSERERERETRFATDSKRKKATKKEGKSKNN